MARRPLKPFAQLSKVTQGRIRSTARQYGVRTEQVRRDPTLSKIARGHFDAQVALALVPSQAAEKWLARPGNLEKVADYVAAHPEAGDRSYERQLAADPNHPPIIFGDPVDYSRDGVARPVHYAQLYRDWEDPRVGAYGYWKINTQLVESGNVVIVYRRDSRGILRAEVFLLYGPH